ACEGCRACLSIRVLVDEFRPSRNLRRVLARNRDIIGEMRVSMPTSEQYSVFRAYLDSRHRDGGMADMTVLDYAMMVEDSHVDTRVVEYRLRDPDSGFTGRSSGPLPPAPAPLRFTPCPSPPPWARASDCPPRSSPRPPPPARPAPLCSSITSPGPATWACLTSISAIGSRARARWTTRVASCRSSG